MLRYPFAFPKVNGRLVGRLNRFVVEADIGGRREQAYLANPGRLWELLVPGASLLLSPSLSRGKLPYTVLTCQIKGRHVLLHTHLTNNVIRSLIDDKLLPPYRDYRVIRAEPVVGKHRFDLLLEHRDSGEHCYLEIKSVTLFAGKTAMFPDAVTERGASHLRLLGELAQKGMNTGCLFVIMNPDVEYFLPAYHVDYNFAQTVLDVKDHVLLKAVTLGFDAAFTKVSFLGQAAIPHAFLEGELHDRGVYLLLLYMKGQKVIALPGGRELGLQEGCYVYAGRAPENLIRETARHKRKRKKKGEPIDYLTAAADTVTPVSVITGEDIESALAAGLGAISDATIPFPGSGSAGSLYYFGGDPLHNRAFIDLILHYRISRLEQRLIAGKNMP